MKNYVKRFFSFRSIVSKLNGVLYFKAYADEPTPPNGDPTPDPDPTPTPDPTPNGTVNWEELVTKARKEEKDKLYPKIKDLEEKRNNLLLVVAERDKEIERLKGELAEAEKTKTTLEKEKGTPDAALTSKNTELSAQITTLEQAIETMKTTHAAELAKKDFEKEKLQLIAAAGEELIPAMITGDTKEEVLASITASQAEYQRIQAKALGGVSYNAAIPNRQQTQLKIDKSPEDIARMTTEEFAEYRKLIGLA